jgi:hypothetical protein
MKVVAVDVVKQTVARHLAATVTCRPTLDSFGKLGGNPVFTVVR